MYIYIFMNVYIHIYIYIYSCFPFLACPRHVLLLAQYSQLICYKYLASIPFCIHSSIPFHSSNVPLAARRLSSAFELAFARLMPEDPQAADEASPRWHWPMARIQLGAARTSTRTDF